MSEKKVDKEIKTKIGQLRQDAQNLLSYVEKNESSIDGSTARFMASVAHEVQARMSEVLSRCENIKSVRLSQSTSLVGGKRSKGG